VRKEKHYWYLGLVFGLVVGWSVCVVRGVLIMTFLRVYIIDIFLDPILIHSAITTSIGKKVKSKRKLKKK
jgi:hypothetical protein